MEDCTEQDILRIYFNEIAKYPLLTREEEKELGRRTKMGDRQARELLIKSNLRLVVSTAKKYQKGRLSLGDLIEEGNIGLVMAVERYDFEKGGFCAYASWWIKQSVIRKIRGKNDSKISSHRLSDFFKIQKIIETFYSENRRNPTKDELAEKLGWKKDRTERTMHFLESSVSLIEEIPEEGEEGMLVLDLTYNPEKETVDKIMERNMKRDIQKALGYLSERDIDIIASYFGLNNRGRQTFNQLAEKYKLTPQGAREIKQRALKKLRTNFKGLRAYLE